MSVAECKMSRGTILWIAVLALCVVGTICEAPNAVLSLRALGHCFVSPEAAPERAVPDKLRETDPEAGDILRYTLAYDYNRDDPNLQALKSLTAKYPDNQYLLSRLADESTWPDGVRDEDVLPIVDRLRQMDPNNAHYLYLKGWVILKASRQANHAQEATKLFDEGHRLSEFRLPYNLYKPRVDRLAEEAVLDEFHRPGGQIFYKFIGNHTYEFQDGTVVDKQSLREFITSTSRMADRVIKNANDMRSLGAGAELMRKIEKARLRYLHLSEPEAEQARLRLNHATALLRVSERWADSVWLTQPLLAAETAGLMAAFLPIFILTNRSKHKRPQTGQTWEKHEAPGDSYAYSFALLLALVTFIVLYKWLPNSPAVVYWGGLPWMMVLISLVCYPKIPIHADALNPRQLRRTYGLFWLNGSLLLLIANTTFFWSRDFTGWPRSLGVLSVWLVFCLLLWYLASHSQPMLGRVSYVTAATVIFAWAIALLALDISGSRWHYESRAYAEPLAAYGPLPALPQAPQTPDAPTPPR